MLMAFPYEEPDTGQRWQYRCYDEVGSTCEQLEATDPPLALPERAAPQCDSDMHVCIICCWRSKYLLEASQELLGSLLRGRIARVQVQSSISHELLPMR
jgi:hypothetical protein